MTNVRKKTKLKPMEIFNQRRIGLTDNCISRPTTPHIASTQFEHSTLNVTRNATIQSLTTTA